MKSAERAATGFLVCASVMLSLPGCHKATVFAPSPADALREENLKLREQVEQLTLRMRELDAGLAQARTSAGAPTTDPAVDAAIPRVASVQIEGASELVATEDSPDSPTMLRLWILPRDGRGRFLQIVGRLHVSVASIRSDAAPVELARATFDPLQIRDAWRSGVMGTHYAFSFPVAVPAGLRSTSLTVTIRFDDSITGRSFEDQRRLSPLRREADLRAPERSASLGAAP